jgi:hypothetical protein
MSCNGGANMRVDQERRRGNKREAGEDKGQEKGSGKAGGKRE